MDEAAGVGGVQGAEDVAGDVEGRGQAQPAPSETLGERDPADEGSDEDEPVAFAAGVERGDDAGETAELGDVAGDERGGGGATRPASTAVMTTLAMVAVSRPRRRPSSSRRTTS